MIKDIIVNLGLGDRDPAGEFAVSMAEIFGAHALGVALAYEPVIPVSVMGGIPPQFIEGQRAETEKTARAATARFEAAAKRTGISYETRVLSSGVSSAVDQIGRMARRFDIAVLGQALRDDGTPDEIANEAVLFESGRPVVFVPFIQKAALALDRVMICWDGSRTAARAVADSMPFLHKAKSVEIVMVETGKGRAGEIPGADLGQHLARHGLRVDVKRISSPDIDVASTILSHAADSSADMIVMGGYGHSRLRQFVLGGVTRSMMESMTVPVLMSH